MKANTCLWAVLTVVMVLIALFIGLLPRGWSTANDVRWLPDSRVIRFQNSGIAYVDDLRAVRLDGQRWPLTIEMAVTPASIQKSGFSPILVMHDGADRRQLAIWQYGASLIVMNGDDYDNGRRQPRVVGRNAFSPNQTRYLTITSGDQGTHLYVDGILADAKPDWKLSIPVEGNPLRLVLGHSVYGKYGWRGDMQGLAITGEALSAEVVKRRFDRWAADRTFDFLKPEPTKLLFTFNRKTGAGFVDESGGNQTLEMPTQMTALKKTVLAPAWRHFHWSRAVAVDVVVNVVGFMPLGIVFYGFLQCFSGPFVRHQHLLAVILCMLLSLGIELAQAWIPTRYSSLLDLILNTFGAWLGIVAWKGIARREKAKG